MINALFSDAGPVVSDAVGTDLVTYLQNGGRFYIPAEAAAMIISAAMLAAAAVILLITGKKERK